MTPIEASSILATLVGLICNWSQERSGQSADRFQDFMVWLSHHHFEGLRERIYDSEELQRELASLLQQDLSVLGSRLDTIAGAISAVADKIDSLSQVGRALGTDTEALSDQASEVLKVFDQNGASRMIVFNHLSGQSPQSNKCRRDQPVNFGIRLGGNAVRRGPKYQTLGTGVRVQDLTGFPQKIRKPDSGEVGRGDDFEF